ncbi:MAG: hypothetical protein CM1200mP11_4560 [Nitrosopumilaceae archaeon]|nr:MAG: hypothetical protein CM1200mP11_4560 [Nitrosopumilaceae archaeon]
MVEDLRLDSLEGVGPVTTRKLSDAGVHNVMDSSLEVLLIFQK